MFRVPVRSIAMALGLALLSSGAFAAEAKKPETKQAAPPPAPTQEQRARMAEMHRQMAECLASDRPIDECRAQMHAACGQPGMPGGLGCPMMGGGGGGGMMGGGGPMMRGTKPAPPAPPAPKQ